jgi:hypothetical protein
MEGTMPTIDLTRSPDLVVTVGPYKRERYTVTASGKPYIPREPPSGPLAIELYGTRDVRLELTLDQLRVLHLALDDFLLGDC